jgi:hypothetical protein
MDGANIGKALLVVASVIALVGVLFRQAKAEVEVTPYAPRRARPDPAGLTARSWGRTSSPGCKQESPVVATNLGVTIRPRLFWTPSAALRPEGTCTALSEKNRRSGHTRMQPLRMISGFSL